MSGVIWPLSMTHAYHSYGSFVRLMFDDSLRDSFVCDIVTYHSRMLHMCGDSRIWLIRLICTTHVWRLIDRLAHTWHQQKSTNVIHMCETTKGLIHMCETTKWLIHMCDMRNQQTLFIRCWYMSHMCDDSSYDSTHLWLRYYSYMTSTEVNKRYSCMSHICHVCYICVAYTFVGVTHWHICATSVIHICHSFTHMWHIWITYVAYVTYVWRLIHMTHTTHLYDSCLTTRW